MVKIIPCQGKHREFGNFAKAQGIWFSQVVNSLIVKVKDILLYATKVSNFFFKVVLSAKSVFYYVTVTNHINWHREDLRLDRE